MPEVLARAGAVSLWPPKHNADQYRADEQHTVYISIPLDMCNIMGPSFYPLYCTFRDRLMQSCSTRRGCGGVGGRGRGRGGENEKEEV